MDEYPAQGNSLNLFKRIDQRTLLDGFLLILILVGLLASVYLAQERQIFHSKASQNGSAEVLNQNGEPIITKDEQGTPVVETQQIRLKIEFPTNWSQSLLPGSVNPAYAQGSPQCLNQNEIRCQGTTCINATYYDGSTPVRDGYEAGCYQCNPSCASGSSSGTSAQTAPAPPQSGTTNQTCFSSGGKCASPDAQGRGVTSEGLKCSSYMGNSALDKSCADTGTGYNYCYLNCREQTQPQAQPQAPIESGPTTPPAPAQGCGTRWEGKRTLCSSENNLPNCTYLDAWSQPRSGVCPASTPFCWACPESAIGAPPQPTPTPQQTFFPNIGGSQPQAPQEEEEQTAGIRISLNEENVKSGNCYNETTKQGAGSSDPRQHCMEFSIADGHFTQRGNLADWYLPSEPGIYTIYRLRFK